MCSCYYSLFFFLMIRRPPRSTLSSSSAASDVYKRQMYPDDADARSKLLANPKINPMAMMHSTSQAITATRNRAATIRLKKRLDARSRISKHHAAQMALYPFEEWGSHSDNSGDSR
eukprot:TRINITY_DN17830_c0_g1_i2.p1 TRINITY_DN17830_c0_g1~~TRINITY_DN17830_c0_g1_i2.p1  ORF type:complete len:116 (+),score=34.93 TRINITY_DN17830_c0_g1_i2:104-451(+)